MCVSVNLSLCVTVCVSVFQCMCLCVCARSRQSDFGAVRSFETQRVLLNPVLWLQFLSVSITQNDQTDTLLSFLSERVTVSAAVVHVWIKWSRDVPAALDDVTRRGRRPSFPGTSAPVVFRLRTDRG